MRQSVCLSVMCVRSANLKTTVVPNAVVGMVVVPGAALLAHGTDGRTDCRIRSGVQCYLNTCEGSRGCDREHGQFSA